MATHQYGKPPKGAELKQSGQIRHERFGSKIVISFASWTTPDNNKAGCKEHYTLDVTEAFTRRATDSKEADAVQKAVPDDRGPIARDAIKEQMIEAHISEECLGHMRFANQFREKVKISMFKSFRSYKSEPEKICRN